MCLNNSVKSSYFSIIFDPSDPYENYPCKKASIKKTFWLQRQARVSMYQFQK